MARVNRYSDNGDKMTSVWNDAGDKRYGFVSTDRIGNGTRYGFGIDNIGSPYRNDYGREINTPLGVLDYGNEGDTVYGGFTPNNYYIQALANLLTQNRQPVNTMSMPETPYISGGSIPQNNVRYAEPVQPISVDPSLLQTYQKIQR